MKSHEIGCKLSKIITGTVLWDENSRNFYSVDSSSYTIKPTVVVLPKNKADIIKIVNFASKYKIPITPRGSGTGLVGSALGTGIIIDMRHFKKIKLRSGYLETESGVLKGELDKVLQKNNKFLGPNPSIGPFCTIGGMIATNASGSHSLKYGSMIENLIGIKMITGEGKVLTLPNYDSKIMKLIPPNMTQLFPKISKNSCGYRLDKIRKLADIHKIVAGSEGTLGVILSARLKVFPLPRKLVLIILTYTTILNAVKEVPDLVKLNPSALELVDSNIARHMKIKISKKGCLLFVEFDTNLHNIKNNVLQKTSAKFVKSASTKKEIQELWKFRNSALSYSIQNITKYERLPTIIEDATVPIRRLPLLLKILDIITRRYGLRLVVYGHVGNGNLHIRPILKRIDRQVIKKIAGEFFSYVIGIGGSITGEHGDGLARSEYVKLQYGEETYSIFKSLKKQFDPKNILNPGKIIFEKSTLTKNLKL